MEHINGVLNRGITSLEIKIMGSGLHVTSGQPKKPGTSNHWHFSHIIHHRIPSHNSNGAAIILPSCEEEVHGHQQPKFFLGSQGVEALGFPDNPRAQFGP